MSPILILIIMAVISEFIKANKKEATSRPKKDLGEITLDDNLSEELQKRFKKEYKTVVEKPQVNRQEIRNSNYQKVEKSNENLKKDRNENYSRDWSISSEEVKTQPKPMKVEKSHKNYGKKDLVRGIIFSEILSEPKSIENMKKNM